VKELPAVSVAVQVIVCEPTEKRLFESTARPVAGCRRKRSVS